MLIILLIVYHNDIGLMANIPHFLMFIACPNFVGLMKGFCGCRCFFLLRLRFGYHRFKVRVHMEVTKDFVTKDILKGISGFIK